ncbi:MAG TPA: DNA recombination protein RmuC [Actinomycetota bacterium]|nr:DNA recombination protein RmuC [Actinomycetota bacterium]
MTTTEVVLLCALAAAGVALVALLRRPRASPEATAAVVRSEVARLTDGLIRQGADERELRADVGRVREVLEGLRAGADARTRAEKPVWDAIRRLEAVLAGGGRRGRAGENLLDEALSTLPPGMLVRDYAVNGRRVEFALVLPDGRRMPVDSKWTAVREIEALEREDSPEARQVLGRRIEDEVARRAREVSAYLDPSTTTPFAVACVPDAAFGACRRAHADAFARGVVLAPYSTALPVLLALYALAARHGSNGDMEGCLAELDVALVSMESTLENKVARAAAMLRSATDEWRTQVGRARSAVARGRGVASRASDQEPIPIEAAVRRTAKEAFVDIEHPAGTR